MLNKQFNLLPIFERIDFFLGCQDFLINNFPSSRFIIRQNNIQDKLAFFVDFIKNYKGYTYKDSNCFVLYNYIKIGEEKDPVKILNQIKFQPPVVDYDSVSIDFATANSMKNLKTFVAANYHHEIKRILFTRNGRAHILNTLDIIEKIGIKKV